MKNFKAVALAAGATLAASTSAFAVATLPIGVTAAFTQLGETATLMETAVWPAIIVVSVATIVIGLYKKFSGKIA